jgi:hypothetical protein
MLTQKFRSIALHKFCPGDGTHKIPKAHKNGGYIIYTYIYIYVIYIYINIIIYNYISIYMYMCMIKSIYIYK